NQGGTCYVATNLYPNNLGTGTTNYMYGIIPGFNNGVQGAAVIPNAPGQINDSITSIYCDNNFSLANYGFTFGAGGTSATATLSATPDPTLPENLIQNGGLTPGDLILFTVSTPGNGAGNQGTSSAQTAAVVAEVTGLPPSASCPSNNPCPSVAMSFSGGDALNFNQGGPNGLQSTVAALGANLGAGNQVIACRLNVVTYFLQIPPAGGTVQNPRLMRQVNGGNAVPVADNVINMQFTYDVINSVNGTISANQPNPLAAGLSPALIQKVNIWL